MDDDIQIHDESCPNCGAPYTYYRVCSAIGCEDGYVNRYDEDPLWYDEDDWEPCQECHGHGRHIWCRACGYDLLNPAENTTGEVE